MHPMLEMSPSKSSGNLSMVLIALAVLQLIPGMKDEEDRAEGKDDKAMNDDKIESPLKLQSNDTVQCTCACL